MMVGGCALPALALEYGTPLYVLDAASIRAACAAYRNALADSYPGPSAIHYAGKALLNLALVSLMRSEGLGLDVVSGGELTVGLRGGMPAGHIHLHGNAKPRAELAMAVAARVGSIVVDNLDELDCLAAVTAEARQEQEILLRIAPDISPNTHPHISTGARQAKFGLPLDALDVAAERVKAVPQLRLRGLHLHLGSQIADVDPYVAAIDVLVEKSAMLNRRHGFAVDTISPGGGLGVAYTAADAIASVPQLVRRIAAATVEAARRHGMALPQLVLEPGRSIVGRAGVGLYTVIARKPLSDGGYVHIDGGIGDNLRPALYGARYSVAWPDRPLAPRPSLVAISGRYCESSDVLVREASAPTDVKPGERIAVAGAGAYTLSMANTYNFVPRPAVVLVAEGQASLIQRRETYDDLLSRDLAPSRNQGEETHDEASTARTDRGRAAD
jgi:diaminopimelate decarboxylase